MYLDLLHILRYLDEILLIHYKVGKKLKLNAGKLICSLWRYMAENSLSASIHLKRPQKLFAHNNPTAERNNTY